MNKCIKICALLFSVTAFQVSVAQQTTPSPITDSVKNAATIPSDGNFKAHTKWNIRCAERVGAMVGQQVDALFIGDSITQNFTEDSDGDWNVSNNMVLHFQPGERGFDLTGRAIWLKYFKERHVLNFGVAADKTEHMLWRMDNMDIRQFHPKVVVVLAGTNNMGYTPEQIAGGVKAILDKVQLMFVDAHILLMSITPRANLIDKVATVNKLIQNYADNDKIIYVDLYSKMIPDGNTWLGIGHDRLHLTPQGYELWASTIDPLLKKYIPQTK